MSQLKCCLCGVYIQANDTYMCLECLKTQVSITNKIETNSELIQVLITHFVNKYITKVQEFNIHYLF